MLELSSSIQSILQKRAAMQNQRALLVGISGIDGSGKGFVTGKIARELEVAGVTVAVIGIDGWLNLPSQRFSAVDPSGHFYHHAIRFDELFHQLILPLRERRSLHLVMNYVEETASEYRLHAYDFRNVDVILAEGVFLFKRSFRHHFDVTLWVDCTFDTALERSLARSQEGLGPEETTRAYENVFFAAQRIHFDRDRPRDAATAILVNDERLSRA